MVMDYFNSDGEGENGRYRKKNCLLQKNRAQQSKEISCQLVNKLVAKKFNLVSRFSPLRVPGRKKRREPVNEVGTILIEK